jgi:F-type H+-transporting ATPase subunit b
MKNILGCAVLMTVLLMGFGVAQESQSAQPQTQQSQSEQPKTGQSQPEQPKQEGTPEAVTPSPEHPKAAETGEKHESLAKSEEEEEENATLKYSPSVTALGKKMGLDAKGSYWLFTGLNFAVVLALVLWLVKSKLMVGMRNRNVSIRSAMETARKASEDANARLAAIEGRLAKLDSEVSSLKSHAENDFKAEEQRIREQAQQDAATVIQLAEQEIATAAKTARRELRVFAADLAVSLAEKRINVDRDTDERLVETFVNQLGKDGK